MIEMDWLSLAIVAYFLYAFNNVNIRGIIGRYARNGRNYLVLFGIIWAFFLVSMLLVFQIPVPSVYLVTILAINGILTAFSLYFLFVAVSKDDVYRVAVLLNLSPVFTAVFSYGLLGETFGGTRLLGLVLLILAGILASLSRDALGHWKLSPALVYGILAALFMAVSNVVFKYATSFVDPLTSLVWGRLFVLLVVVVVLIRKSWRNDFLKVLKNMSVSGFSIVLLNESIALIATLAFICAIATSTATLVSALGATYPVFVFIFGAMYTLVKPDFVMEDLSKHTLLLKLSSLTLLIPGVILVS